MPTGAFGDAALAGHDGAFGAETAPVGSDGEIVVGHVAAVDGGGDGDGGEFGTRRAWRDAGRGRVGIERAGQFAAAGSGIIPEAVDVDSFPGSAGARAGMRGSTTEKTMLARAPTLPGRVPERSVSTTLGIGQPKPRLRRGCASRDRNSQRRQPLVYDAGGGAGGFGARAIAVAVGMTARRAAWACA